VGHLDMRFKSLGAWSYTRLWYINNTFSKILYQLFLRVHCPQTTKNPYSMRLPAWVICTHANNPQTTHNVHNLLGKAPSKIIVDNARKSLTIHIPHKQNAAFNQPKGHYMKPGNYITTTIYGHAVRVLVLAVHRGGSIDVQRADGKCFRISGVTV
jgi:hypothetical protein